MAKRSKVTKESNATSGAKFLDKTNMSWYNKKGSNQVIFCNSIDDIMEGKGETYTFTNNILSFKMLNRKDKKVESSRFFLFILDDGDYVLANKWNAL